jgi:hypothetical protein
MYKIIPYEVFSKLEIDNAVLWVMSPYILVGGYRRVIKHPASISRDARCK